jgi:hypothetical protein
LSSLSSLPSSLEAFPDSANRFAAIAAIAKAPPSAFAKPKRDEVFFADLL